MAYLFGSFKISDAQKRMTFYPSSSNVFVTRMKQCIPFNDELCKSIFQQAEHNVRQKKSTTPRLFSRNIRTLYIKHRERTRDHPYSIYIWKPPRSSTGKGAWIEPVQVYTQEYALYVANLIHKDSRSVIKVVRYGITLACFPDEKTVQRVEKQISRQQEELRIETDL